MFNDERRIEMTNHAIVIGANYGDEGKGLMTNYLAKQHNAKRVIRFNGGAQAGHTVIHEGRRFINSSFGSATQLGIQTEIASTAILHPGVARQEATNLLDAGINFHPILVHANSMITTPLDQAINQLIELRRGNTRHGSCGLGINETVQRHQFMKNIDHPKFSHPDYFKFILDVWVPHRMDALKFSASEISTFQKSMLEFDEKWQFILEKVFGEDQIYKLIEADNTADGFTVYEGAQGLALDEELGSFPHVTHSNTGIRNALLHLLQKPNAQQKERVEIVYCSRAYLTRHGAGPLPNENLAENVIGSIPFDPTNKPNEWQGSIRYAPLDLFDLVHRIESDLFRNKAILDEAASRYEIKPVLALTCLDQSEEFLVVPKLGAKPVKMSASSMSDFIQDTYRLRVKYESYGPASTDVAEYSSRTRVKFTAPNM